MSFHLKPNDFSGSFSQKLIRKTHDSPFESNSLAHLLGLKVKNHPKFFFTGKTSPKKIFTQFLQKSPNSQFQPGEKPKEKKEFVAKVEPLKLTQSTRKEGPARHRNSILLKLDLINRTRNKSLTPENNKSDSQPNLEMLSSVEGRRPRARSSLAPKSLKTPNERPSSKTIKVVSRFYQDFISDVREERGAKGSFIEKSNENSQDRSSSRNSFYKAFPSQNNRNIPSQKNFNCPQIQEKEMNVGFNICQDVKFVNSNHFFNRIREKKVKEANENPGKRLKKAKSDVFYEDLMLSHVFMTKLSDEERDRFSGFLMSDWMNKLIFERKINDSGYINEFLGNTEEMEKLSQTLSENQKIREQFQKTVEQIDKNELFRPPNILNRFRESIHLTPAAQVKKAFKLSSLNEYLKTKNYLNRDKLYKLTQNALKNLKTRKQKRRKKTELKIEKERIWEIRDSLIEHYRMIIGSKGLGEFLKNGLPQRPFETSGSYMFLSFVKKGKIAYLESLLIKDKRLVFDFDMLGKTGLHIACESGFSDVANLLLKYHARVNVRDILGRTPLYFAAKNNDHTIVYALFRSFARPWSTSKCNYQELGMNEILKDLFKKARIMDLIRKLTPKRLINSDWEQSLVEKYFPLYFL